MDKVLLGCTKYKKQRIDMKDNSWQNFMNKGQGGQKGQGGNAKAANTKGNGASAKQMNRRTQ